MKSGIHPTYHDDATITCSCGNVIKTGSTKESYTTELCSKCHPFYTGKQKTVDSAGRIEKFKAQQEAAAKKKSEKSARGGKKTKKSIEEKVNEALQKEKEREEKEDAKLKSKITKKPANVVEMPTKETDEVAEETDKTPEEEMKEAA